MIQEDTTQLSDAELVQKTLENQNYFAALIERYEARVLRYIRRISNGSEQDAEDILQDAFIKAYYNLRGFDVSKSFSAWMYRIVHNQTISSYRKKQVRPEGHALDVEDGVLETIVTDFDLGQSVDKALLREELNVVLAKLDWKYREVLVLRFFQDKSYEEISEILRKPPGTVATLLNRAKKQAQSHIQKSKHL